MSCGNLETAGGFAATKSERPLHTSVDLSQHLKLPIRQEFDSEGPTKGSFSTSQKHRPASAHQLAPRLDGNLARLLLLVQRRRC